jgi:hypothetical protein
METNPYAPPADHDYSSDVQAVTRPVGVWIATVYAGLFAGVLPLAVVAFLAFGPGNLPFVVSGLDLAIAALLGMCITASAIGAWRGSSTSRYILVLLVVIHYGLMAYKNYVLADAEMIGGGLPRVIGRILTGTIIATYLLFGKKANAFFRQNRQAAEPMDSAMTLQQTKREVLEAIDLLEGQLPVDQLREMRDLVLAGEPGIALENLCTQVDEFNVNVPPSFTAKVKRLGSTMGLKLVLPRSLKT